MYNNSQISFKAKLPGRFIYKKKKNDNQLIFSVTCDYSFNNRRMDIILSDINFLKKENKVFENKIDADEQKSQQKVIDTSGI